MDKVRYLIGRLALTIFSFWAVVTVLFFLFRVLPGDPTSHIVDPRISPEQRETMLEIYGLTEPLYVQYYYYILNFLQGDLGYSFQHGTDVLPFILARTFNTLIITFPAIVAAFVIGPLIGATLAWNRNERIDNVGTALFLTTYAAPIFWTGMIAIMVFSFQLNVLPSGGMYPPGGRIEGYADRLFSLQTLRYAILPIIVFALWRVSRPMLITRNTMIDVLDTEFIELKRAEGLSELKLRYKHALRNSLLPVLHYGALALGYAFGGSVVLETVFSWPGLGYAMWQAVLAHDYPVVQGAFYLMALMVILFNLLADIVTVWIDPRVKDQEVVE